MSMHIREDLLPQPGAVVAGHYRIDALIGHGGMGAVFAATHTRTNRAVAIKWMLPQAATSAEALHRFIAEAQATARIEHPNVVHIYDYGQTDGAPYLVMELLRGESLRARLDRVGRLTAVDAVNTLLPAMRGVLEAHREGIIHRDLKPDNIFLCVGKDGSPREPKVVDFGISKLFDSNGPSNLTGTGMMMGTPHYMSPEQLNAPKDADVRFDVYALGVVLYETICGRCPYEADGIFQLVGRIMSSEPMRPSLIAPDVTPDLEAVVLRAMHREAAQRYQDVPALMEALQRAQAGLHAARAGVAATHPISAPPPAMPYTPMPSGPGVGAPGVGTPFPPTALGHRTPAGTAVLHATPPPGTYPGYGAGSHAGGGYPGAPDGSYPGGSYPGGSYPGGSYPGGPGSYPGAPHPGSSPGVAPGSYPGVPYGTMTGPISTPHAAYPHPPAKSGGGLKWAALGMLALLFGGASAGGAWYFVLGPGATSPSERAETTEPGPVAGLPATALDTPLAPSVAGDPLAVAEPGQPGGGQPGGQPGGGRPSGGQPSGGQPSVGEPSVVQPPTAEGGALTPTEPTEPSPTGEPTGEASPTGEPAEPTDATPAEPTDATPAEPQGEPDPVFRRPRPRPPVPQPVIRPVGPGPGPSPIVTRPPPSRPGTGTNGAMIIE